MALEVGGKCLNILTKTGVISIPYVPPAVGDLYINIPTKDGPVAQKYTPPAVGDPYLNIPTKDGPVAIKTVGGTPETIVWDFEQDNENFYLQWLPGGESYGWTFNRAIAAVHDGVYGMQFETHAESSGETMANVGVWIQSPTFYGLWDTATFWSRLISHSVGGSTQNDGASRKVSIVYYADGWQEEILILESFTSADNSDPLPEAWEQITINRNDVSSLNTMWFFKIYQGVKADNSQTSSIESHYDTFTITY
jgi:hypothetical protein